MSHEDYNKFLDRLEKKGAKIICPVCGDNKVSTSEDYAALPISGGERLIPFKSVKCLYVTCDGCGYIRMFDLKTALE